jgi:hypothetical protein
MGICPQAGRPVERQALFRRRVIGLTRPDGNTTGVSMFAPELDGKRQDFLIEAMPGIRTMAAMADPTMSQTTPQHMQDLQAAARSRKVELSISTIARPDELVPAIDAAKASGAEALNFLASPMFLANRQIIVEHVAAVGCQLCTNGPNSPNLAGSSHAGRELWTFTARQRGYS